MQLDTEYSRGQKTGRLCHTRKHAMKVQRHGHSRRRLFALIGSMQATVDRTTRQPKSKEPDNFTQKAAKLTQYYVVGLVLSVLCFGSVANYAVTLP